MAKTKWTQVGDIAVSNLMNYETEDGEPKSLVFFCYFWVKGNLEPSAMVIAVGEASEDNLTTLRDTAYERYQEFKADPSKGIESSEMQTTEELNETNQQA